MATARFVRRLGPHHFAYLRAVSDGLDLGECARRYLGIEHGHEAKTAHHEAVDAVSAVARRQGDGAWRLVGLRIQSPVGVPRPSLEAFAQQHGLDGFSESEVVKLYTEAFPLSAKPLAASACGSASSNSCVAWRAWPPRRRRQVTWWRAGLRRLWRPSSSRPACSRWGC